MLIRCFKQKLGIAGSVIFLFMNTCAFSSELAVRNSFSAGTPALADEVNQNFTDAANAVTDNHSRISSLESQLATMQTAIMALQQSVNSLQTENTSLTQEITSLTAANQNLSSELSTLQNEVVSGLADFVTVGNDARGNNSIIISAANVHINNGSGATNSANALGNLIIGYDGVTQSSNALCSDGLYGDQTSCEQNGHTWALSHKNGSHNLIIGDQHNYSRYAGMVVGVQNSITGGYASVCGGQRNSARGLSSSISGGAENTAITEYSSITGGRANTTQGQYATISGGESNQTNARSASISGGELNQVSARGGSVSGGVYNEAAGELSTVSGGYEHSANGFYDWVAGNLFEDE